MESNGKKLYDYMLKNGELLEMFPHFEGKWQEDKRVFLEMYEANQNLFK